MIFLKAGRVTRKFTLGNDRYSGYFLHLYEVVVVATTGGLVLLTVVTPATLSTATTTVMSTTTTTRPTRITRPSDSNVT